MPRTDQSRPTLQRKILRDRAVNTTLDVLKERGYDQTSIREVAKRSTLALGTLYSQFGSKDALILEGTEAWVSKTFQQAIGRMAELPEANRLENEVRLSIEALMTEPLLLEAWVRVGLSTNLDVIHRLQKERPGEGPGHSLTSAGTPTDDIGMVIDHVWYTGRVRWALGQQTLADVQRNVQRAASLALKAQQSAHEISKESVPRREKAE